MPEYVPTIQNATVAPYLIKGTDFSHLQKAIDTMSERHIKALDARAGIAKDIAERYNLNPAEDEFKTDFTNEMLGEIDKSIDANSGYAGNALTAALDVSKKYVSDPRLLGRQRAQTAYQSFLDSLDKMNISDDQKQYLREQNPYYYFDKKEGETEDEAIKNRQLEQQYAENPEEFAASGQTLPETSNNKIVGGTSWEKDKAIVAEQDINGFMGRILQQVGRNTGFNYETLRASDIYTAVMNGFDTNGEMNDWLYRKWEIARWKYDRDPNNPDPDILSDGGIVRNFDEFKHAIVDKFARTSAYSKYVGPRTPTAPVKPAKDDGKGQQDVDFWAGVSMPAGSISASDEPIADVLNRELDTMNQVQSLIDMLYPNGEGIDDDTKGQIQSNLGYAIDWLQEQQKDGKIALNPQQEAQLRQLSVQYNQDSARHSDMTPDIMEAQAFIAAIDAGKDVEYLIRQGNKYAIEYRQYYTDLINNDCRGADYVYIPISDESKYKQLWGTQEQRDYNHLVSSQYDVVGVPRDSNDFWGRDFGRYIKIPKGDIHKLYNIYSELIRTGCSVSRASSLKSILPFQDQQAFPGIYITGQDFVSQMSDKNSDAAKHIGIPHNYVRVRGNNYTNDYLDNLENARDKAQAFLEQQAYEETPTARRQVTVSPFSNQLAALAAKNGLSVHDQATIDDYTRKAIQNVDNTVWSNAQIGISSKTSDSQMRQPINGEKLSGVVNILRGILGDSNESKRVTISCDADFNGYVISVAGNTYRPDDDTNGNYDRAQKVEDVYLDGTGEGVTLTSDSEFSIYVKGLLTSEDIDKLLGGKHVMETRDRLRLANELNDRILINETVSQNNKNGTPRVYMASVGNDVWSIGDSAGLQYGTINESEANYLLLLQKDISNAYISNSVRIPKAAIEALLNPSAPDFNDPDENRRAFMKAFVSNACAAFQQPYLIDNKIASDKWSPQFKNLMSMLLNQIASEK